jgi:condensin complex subunit 2
MTAQMPLCEDISPTLRDIVVQFDEENQRPSHEVSSGQMLVMEDKMVSDNDPENDDSMLLDSGMWDFGVYDDHEDVYDESYNQMESNSTNFQEVFSCRIGKIKTWP